MEPDQTLAMLLVFSIPILAILLGFAKEWLKVRAQQRTLGESRRELDQKIERLERANAEYVERLENLEAVVVSQAWSALQDRPKVSGEVHPPTAAEDDGHGRIVPVRPHGLPAPSMEDLNRQRAADLARRVGG